MKLSGQTIVMVPWWDAEGMKQWLRLTFQGEADSRFIFRQIRVYIQKEFNKVVDKQWIKAHCPIINEALDYTGSSKIQSLSNDESFTGMINEWVERLEADEDENESDTLLQNGDTERPEQPLCAVPDGIEY